jgi:hypothetical protein
LIRFDHARFEIMDSFEFPRGSLAGAVQWLPGGPKGAGYLLVAVASHNQRDLSIFDAAAINRGPLCVLGHSELVFGLTLHTAWLSCLTPATSQRIPVHEEIGPQIHGSKKLTRFFEDYVFSR